jgi:hypothetical protein
MDLHCICEQYIKIRQVVNGGLANVGRLRNYRFFQSTHQQGKLERLMHNRSAFLHGCESAILSENEEKPAEFPVRGWNSLRPLTAVPEEVATAVCALA